MKEDLKYELEYLYIRTIGWFLGCLMLMIVWNYLMPAFGIIQITYLNAMLIRMLFKQITGIDPVKEGDKEKTIKFLKSFDRKWKEKIDKLINGGK